VLYLAETKVLGVKMKKIYGICLLIGFLALLLTVKLFTTESNRSALDESAPETEYIQDVIIEDQLSQSPIDDSYPAPSSPIEPASYPAPEAQIESYPAPAPTSSNVTWLSNKSNYTQSRQPHSVNTSPESDQHQSTTGSSAEQLYNYFIPLVLLSKEKKGALITGVEVNRGHGTAVATRAREAQLSWVRYNGIAWSEVEPKPGEWNWDALKGFERDLENLIDQGMTPMVIVRGTPEWAQKVEGAFCGPIKEEALDDFAAFMQELVTRYSQPPFNIKYWEIGNEPDVDPSLIAPTEPFGCWGDQHDEFYGGEYFAHMLKQVYPAIKAADPQAQVILGGLALDCDPSAPPEGKDCQPGHFFEGILRAGGGNAFDIVAYHVYPYWQANVIDSDLTNQAWQQRGGLLLGKLDFLREVMARYNLNKPIMMNEGALLCYPTNTSCPSDVFLQAQASYLPRLYARGWVNGLEGIIWYTLNGPGWREGGLLDEARNPRPAYTALSFMGQLLGDAFPNGQLSSGDLEGYSFKDDYSEIQLYWSNSEQTHTIPLPLYTHAIYNKFGDPLAQGKFIEISADPIYIQIVK